LAFGADMQFRDRTGVILPDESVIPFAVHVEATSLGGDSESECAGQSKNRLKHCVGKNTST
jgi:hypothetical protein